MILRTLTIQNDIGGWMSFKALVDDHGLPKAAAFNVFNFNYLHDTE